jgi:hypothetical protein
MCHHTRPEDARMAIDRKTRDTRSTRTGGTVDNSTIPKGPRVESAVRGKSAPAAGMTAAARRGVPGLALPVLGKGRWVVVSVKPAPMPPRPKSRGARDDGTIDNSTIPKGPRVEIVYEWEE